MTAVYVLFAQLMCVGGHDTATECKVQQECFIMGRTLTPMPLEKCEPLKTNTPK